MAHWKKILLALLPWVLLVPLLVLWLAPPASSSPPFPIPSPNGYDQLLQAAEAFQAAQLTATNHPQAFVAKHQATYGLLATALSLPSEAPSSTYGQSSAIRLAYQRLGFQLLAHALQLKGRSLETNNPSAALDAYFDIIRLGQRVEHGPVINLLIGLSLEKMGLLKLSRLVPSLSPTELDHYRETLRQLNSARIGFDEITEREKFYVRRNTQNPLQALLSRFHVCRGLQRAKADYDLMSADFNDAITNLPKPLSTY